MAASTLDPQLVRNIQTIKSEMANTLIERADEIDLVVLSILSGQHGLFIGEPGVAKSLTVNNFLDHIPDASRFSILLNQAMPPTEVLGPISVQGLTQDRYKHIIDGRLPDVQVGFLDEIFKANPVLLNSLLAILNERVYHDDGKEVPVPLWCAFGASNELPDDPVLLAFRDRMPWTKIVGAVKTDDSFKSVLRGNVERRAGTAVSQTTQPTLLTVQEIETLQSHVKQVEVTEDFLDAMTHLRRDAGKEGISISARRWAAGIALCQAQATVAGRDKVVPSDLMLFEHILWLNQKDIPVSREVSSEFAGKVAKATATLSTSLNGLRDRFQAISGDLDNQTDQASEVVSQMKRLVEEIDKGIKRAEGDGEDATSLRTLRENGETLRKDMWSAMMGA